MPPTRRHDIPARSLDAMVLQMARQDYSAILFRQIFRPSLVFHYDLRYDPYHREYASVRNPLVQSVGPGEQVKWDDRVYFEMYMPEPTRPATLITVTSADEENLEHALEEHYNGNPSNVNKRVRRLSALVIDLALLIRRKLRATTGIAN